MTASGCGARSRPRRGTPPPSPRPFATRNRPRTSLRRRLPRRRLPGQRPSPVHRLQPSHSRRTSHRPSRSPRQQPPAKQYQPPAQPPAKPYQPPAQPSAAARRRPAAAQAYPEAGARPYPPAQPGGSSIFRQPSAIMRLPSRVLRIGRANDNEIVVSDLSVSRYHAELRRDSRGGYEIADLTSHNGTYVNGQRVTSAPVTEADIISIGPATFHVVGQELVEFIDTGDVSLNVQGIDRPHLRREGAARPGQLPARRAVPARRDRAQRRGQVDAARRADRDAARGRGLGALRQPRPLQELRGAEAPDRPGAAGGHHAHPADRPPRAALRRGAAVPPRHQRQGAQRAGRRGDRRARADQARPDPRLGAVRRAAQAGERRARAAHQAIAAVPRRADVRARPGARQVGDGDDGPAGARRPHRHRGHAQRRQPRPVRPAAGPGSRRQGRVLRAAARRPEALRQAGLGRGVPGVRRRAEPGLGRGVQAVPAATRSTSPPARTRSSRRPARGRSRRRRAPATTSASCPPWSGATWRSSRRTRATWRRWR